MTAASLTPKQQRFVDEYLIDLNATQAAVRAGYSEKTADVQGPRLLGNVGVRAAIRAAQVERSKATKIDQAWIIERAVEVIERSLQHRPVLDRRGEPVMVETPTGEEAPAYAFDARGAVAGLVLLAKHTGGFVDRTEHAGPGGGPIQLEAMNDAMDRLTPDERATLRNMALKLERGA